VLGHHTSISETTKYRNVKFVCPIFNILDDYRVTVQFYLWINLNVPLFTIYNNTYMW